MSTNQVVIRANAKEFPKVAEGDGGVGLEAKVAVVMSRSQVAAFPEKTRVEEPAEGIGGVKHEAGNFRASRFHTPYATSGTYLGKKMLSTTTKSCISTSRSAFWLKLPTV